MVEGTLKRRKYFDSRNQLFETLPKKVMPQSLTILLKYSEESRKVSLNKDGSITWIFPSFPKNKKTKASKKSKPSKSRLRKSTRPDRR
jgi:hypothetical protein